LILADKHVYACGDYEAGCLGRMPVASSRKEKQGLRIEAIGQKGVSNIFTGAFHSFCEKVASNGKTQYFGWGSNLYG